MKYQVYVSKKSGFDLEAKGLENSLKENIQDYQEAGLKIVNHYLIESPENLDIEYFAKNVLAEPSVDIADTEFNFSEFPFVLPIRYLPAQYDQRADFAAQVLESMTGIEKIKVRSAKIYCFSAKMNEHLISEIKNELINPIESMEVGLDNLSNFEKSINNTSELKPIEELVQGKISAKDFITDNGLAMSIDDMNFIIDYFKSENRAPNMLEIKALDTYWSDHCRHTTFTTEIKDIKFDEDNKLLKSSLDEYYSARKELNRESKPVSLMDLATINAKYHTYKNKEHNIDISEEINACSINVDCKLENGSTRKALLMFKNETHNHPTEIEPFGGAATCLGGAIRDPLSGRTYVYGAMRVTGAGDPTTPKSETLAGKLPQYRICREAAKGYSSYGNQIGLATGIVKEFYNQGFLAKRFELGAVIAACPKENVIREIPKKGDLVLLLGGRTGRDGIGGATGSSKSHTDESLMSSGGEVQKGNPPTERKLQRLFMNPSVAKMIKRCNDFGAGGVAVAVGEIADSIDINLDKVPTKYDGLNALETAISESQERMAVVIAKENLEKFTSFCNDENIESTVIAEVTDSSRLKMFSKGKVVLDFSRKFLDSGGVRGEQKVDLNMNTDLLSDYFVKYTEEDIRKDLNESLSELSKSSQKGLIEMFDSTIGTATVFYPLGGKTRLSPNDVMLHRIPLEGEITKTMSGMTFGYDPDLAMISEYHAGYYAVLMSITNLVAAGFSHKKVKLSLQEYFEKLGKDEKKWAKPFLALLGAMKAQFIFDAPAIGGKDSMSGTFNDINVPPSIVSFAVSYMDEKPIKNVFDSVDSDVYIILPKMDDDYLIDSDDLKNKFDKYLENRDKIVSARAVDNKGVLINLFEMAVGNKCDITVDEDALLKINSKCYGGIIVQTDEKTAKEIGATKLADISVQDDAKFRTDGVAFLYDDLIKSYEEKLEKVYPILAETEGEIENLDFNTSEKFASPIKVVKPRAFIPVFPGTNCEIDTARAFERAGAESNVVIFKNQSKKDIDESIMAFEQAIKDAHIVAIPGGFSAGDEPEGSAKFITAVFRNERLKDALNELIKNRDGLAIGICNGFQALIKLGVFDKGEIGEIDENSPTLTYNTIGRHVSNIVKVRIASNNSPWLAHTKAGDVFNVAISHGEGRFACNDDMIRTLIENNQIATQYSDEFGNASMDALINPNGSRYAVEGLISKDGRVLGKMGHTERYLEGLYQNIDGSFDTGLFKSGVEYFKV